MKVEQDGFSVGRLALSRSSEEESMSDQIRDLEGSVSRREFVKRTGVGVGGLLVAPLAAEPAWARVTSESAPAAATIAIASVAISRSL